MKKVILLTAILMGLASCTTNIYLVRHAEKRDNSSNTALSAAGELRAIALRDQLKNKKIDAIYATSYLRTQLTAKPLADAAGKDIITYQPDVKFSETLKNMKGKNVLVVGHSNTVPEIVRYLTGKTVTINEDDFDNLYRIRIKGSKIILETDTYGAGSP